jgi:hypothetical protein
MDFITLEHLLQLELDAAADAHPALKIVAGALVKYRLLPKNPTLGDETQALVDAVMPVVLQAAPADGPLALAVAAFAAVEPFVGRAFDWSVASAGSIVAHARTVRPDSGANEPLPLNAPTPSPAI